MPQKFRRVNVDILYKKKCIASMQKECRKMIKDLEINSEALRLIYFFTQDVERDRDLDLNFIK